MLNRSIRRYLIPNKTMWCQFKREFRPSHPLPLWSLKVKILTVNSRCLSLSHLAPQNSSPSNPQSRSMNLCRATLTTTNSSSLPPPRQKAPSASHNVQRAVSRRIGPTLPTSSRFRRLRLRPIGAKHQFKWRESPYRLERGRPWGSRRSSCHPLVITIRSKCRGQSRREQG